MSVKSGLVAVASQRVPWLSRHVLASAGYTLDVDRLLAGSDGVWTRHTAERQEKAWRPLVDEALAGRPRDDIQAVFELLDPIVSDGTSLLEVGAGTGHVSEILVDRYPAMQYTGLEISAPSVAIALERYPGRAFVVGSAYELPYEDDAFDVVVDGVALLHMDHWRNSLAEYARVARRSVVLHGLTLTTGHPTTRFAKYAYGQPTTELVFDRAELLAACEDLGLTLDAETDGLDYDLGPYIGIPSSSPSWRLSPAR